MLRSVELRLPWASAATDAATAGLGCDTICNHGVALKLDHLPDDTPVRSLGARMACNKCGRVGAEVQSDWSPHTKHQTKNEPRAEGS